MEEKIENPITENEETSSQSNEVELPEPEKVNTVQDEKTPYDQVIEESRLNLLKTYKKSRTRSNIMMLVVLAAAVGSLLLITQESPALKITGWSVIGVVVVGMIVFYALTKNKFPNLTKEYIKTVNEQLNGRNFSDTQFEEVTSDSKDKLELGDLVSDGAFKGAQIGSRNVVNAKYAKRSVTVGDVAFYKGTTNNKQKQTAFVGKYISYPNDLHFEGRYVLNYKNKDEKFDQPDDIADLIALKDEETVSFYGKEGADIAADLTNNFLDALSKIEIKGALLNVVVAVWSGHTAVYLSYSDDIMALPFEKQFNKEANEQYRSNLLQVLSACALIKK